MTILPYNKLREVKLRIRMAIKQLRCHSSLAFPNETAIPFSSLNNRQVQLCIARLENILNQLPGDKIYF